MRLRKLLMLATLISCSLFISSCGTTSVPLKVKLPIKPVLAEFTNEEMKAIPMSAHEKILDYGFEWEGWAAKIEMLPCVEK